MLIWYKKKTDENKQNCQGRLATGKGTFFVVFQGRIDTDKYNTSLNILTPCLDLFGTWCFSSPQLVNLGTTYLGNSGLSVYQMRLNDHLWQRLPFHPSRKSAAPRPIQIKDLQPMCEMQKCMRFQVQIPH